MFTENFDGAGLPTTLDYSQTDPFFTWSVDGSNRLLADRTENQRGVATAISNDGFSLSDYSTLTFSADIGTPVGADGIAYNVGMVFGDYVALIHPGYDEGAFRLEKISGQIDPIESALIGNRAMGFQPQQGVLHRVEAGVTLQGQGLQIDVVITGLGADSALHTFEISYLDPNPGLGAGRIGVAVRGGASSDNTPNDGFFDNLKIEGVPVIPEPTTIALFAFGLCGAGLMRRRKRGG